MKFRGLLGSTIDTYVLASQPWTIAATTKSKAEYGAEGTVGRATLIFETAVIKNLHREYM